MGIGIFTDMGKKLKNVLIFIAVLYGVWLLDLILVGVNLGQYGIRPRKISGLIGIITAPLLHANIMHLFSNTLPLIILLTLFSFAYPKKMFPTISLIIILGGSLVWIFGRSGVNGEAIHVGASGLIYGVAAFIIIHGFLTKDFKNIILSVIVIIAYGGLIWGLLPSATRWWISFEGHLFGAFAGGVAAYLLKTKKTEVGQAGQGI